VAAYRAALDAGADLVGVNQRDLRTFEVDTDRAARLAPLVPSEVVTVAESGVRGADDVAALAAAGYDAVLVGQALVTAADPVATVGALVEAARRPTTPQATIQQATTPQEV
jgi:indole-3-glycerol phosphate synthase